MTPNVSMPIILKSMLVALWLSVFPGAATQSHAAAFVVEIEALIDGRDQLIIQGNTLQWHHFRFAAVGRHDGRNKPTVISTQLNGVTIMDGVEWIPQWSAPPPDRINSEGFSSIFTDLAPGLPLAELSLQLIEIESRGATTMVELPTAANGFSTVIDFNDNSLGALEIYIAPLEFDFVTEANEPGVVAVLGLGFLGLAFSRRKRRGSAPLPG